MPKEQERRIRKIIDEYPLLSYEHLKELIANSENVDANQCEELLKSYNIFK